MRVRGRVRLGLVTAGTGMTSIGIGAAAASATMRRLTSGWPLQPSKEAAVAAGMVAPEPAVRADQGGHSGSADAAHTDAGSSSRGVHGSPVASAHSTRPQGTIATHTRQHDEQQLLQQRKAREHWRALLSLHAESGGDGGSDGGGRMHAALRRAKERADYARDREYGSARPLVNLPWLTESRPSYIHAAERKYGRKETWCAIEDDETRLKLCVLLRDYISELANETRDLYRSAMRRSASLTHKGDEFADLVMSALHHDLEPLRKWKKPAQPSKGKRGSGGDDNNGDVDEDGRGRESTHTAADGRPSTSSSSDSTTTTTTTTTTADVSADLERGQQEIATNAFPFLRSKLQSDSEALDDDLKDWIASTFPDDRPEAFRPPADTPASAASAAGDAGGRSGGVGAELDATFVSSRDLGERDAAGVRRAELLESLGITRAATESAESAPPVHAVAAAGGKEDASARRQHRAEHAVAQRELLRSATPLHRKLSALRGGRFDSEGVLLQNSARPASKHGVGAVNAQESRYVKIDWGTARTMRGSPKRDPRVHAARERAARIKKGEHPLHLPSGAHP